jgi:hypothetical protein
MGIGLLVAAALAAVTAVIVLRFLPARESVTTQDLPTPGRPRPDDSRDLQPQN